MMLGTEWLLVDSFEVPLRLEMSGVPGLLAVGVVTFDDTVELQCSLANPKNVVITLEPRYGSVDCGDRRARERQPRRGALGTEHGF